MSDKMFHAVSAFFDKNVAIGVTGTTGTAVASKALDVSVMTSNDMLTYISIFGGVLTCIYMGIKIFGQWRIQNQEIELNNQKLNRRHDDEQS